MISEIIKQIVELQAQTVERWHREPMDLSAAVADFCQEQRTAKLAQPSEPSEPSASATRRQSTATVSGPVISSLWCNRGLLEVICRQHSFNYLLWHEEDLARSPTASDAQIAQVKRAIDRYNQQRNDWIEKVDDWLSAHLEQHGVIAQSNAGMNTETPGSTFDRLSILALRIFHLHEELARPEITDSHRDKVEGKLSICEVQQVELAQALADLLDQIFAGQKRHRTYRQCKMYNDPSLNPAVYRASRQVA